jgi:hypothetical protein
MFTNNFGQISSSTDVNLGEGFVSLFLPIEKVCDRFQRSNVVNGYKP